MESLRKNQKGNPVFLCCLIAYTMIYVGRVNLSVASPLMINEGAADIAGIGILGSIFSITYAAGRLLSGRICDRAAPKLVITAGICIAGIANLMMGTAPGYLLMALLWGFNALGQSVLWGSVLNSMSATYEGSELKKRSALMTTSIPVGNIIGYLLSSYLCVKTGWQAAFYVPGVLCILSGIAAYFILKEIRLKTSLAAEKSGRGSAAGVFKEIPSRDFVGKLIPAFLHGLIKDNSSFWLPTILAMQYMVKSELTGLFVVIVPCIGFAGRLVYPAALRLAGDDEEKVSFWCFAAAGICAGILAAGVKSPVLVSVLIGVIYAVTSMINTTFLSVYPLRFQERGCTATISGIMDFLTYLGASAGSAVFGIMASKLGYTSLYVSWAVISVLAVILLLAGRKKCA